MTVKNCQPALRDRADSAASAPLPQARDMRQALDALSGPRAAQTEPPLHMTRSHTLDPKAVRQARLAALGGGSAVVTPSSGERKVRWAKPPGASDADEEAALT